VEELNEAMLGVRRIAALVDRDKVAHALGCTRCRLREETEGYLAMLGWTGPAFLIEAYPEFYGDVRG
jgi:hypothetical protein